MPKKSKEIDYKDLCKKQYSRRDYECNNGCRRVSECKKIKEKDTKLVMNCNDSISCEECSKFPLCDMIEIFSRKIDNLESNLDRLSEKLSETIEKNRRNE